MSIIEGDLKSWQTKAVERLVEKERARAEAAEARLRAVREVLGPCWDRGMWCKNRDVTQRCYRCRIEAALGEGPP